MLFQTSSPEEGGDLHLHHHHLIDHHNQHHHHGDDAVAPTWLLDSGASMHFTHDMNDFVEYVPLDDQFTISTANGVTAVEGYGTVILNCPDNVGRTTVRITPVFYIPDLTLRLLSMGEF